MSERLDGKVALLLGASRGIGQATAELLAQRGAAVMLAARGGDACATIAAGIRAAGGRASSTAVDIADYEAVTQVVKATEKTLGPVDILLNNAAVIDPIGLLADCDPAEWRRNIDINLTGAFHGIHAVLSGFLQRGSGTIINISSGAASVARDGWTAYCCAKAGLAMLTQCIHVEYAERGITVFGMRPGLVDTSMQAQVRASGINAISKLDRSVLAPPEHPARAIAYLCTPAAKALNGRELDLREKEFRALVGLEQSVTIPPSR